MKSREGFFQIAADLATNPLTDMHVVSQLNELGSWFEENLARPERLTRTKFKGFYRRGFKGLSWFKPTAVDHISKGYQMKAILEEYGYNIDVIKSDRIGFIIYEDEDQIVAEPFSDTNK